MRWYFVTDEDKEKLQEILERLQMATQGEWVCEPRHVCFYDDTTDIKTKHEASTLNLTQNLVHAYGDDEWLGAHVVIKDQPEPGRGEFTVRNAWFIANAKDDINWLIQKLQER